MGNTRNLGTDYAISVGETVELVQEITNKKVEVEIDKQRLRTKKSEVDHLLASNKYAKKIINWQPIYSKKSGFKEGLKKTIEWFERPENIKSYKSDIYNL